MKTSYFVCAATAFAAVVGGASAWPVKAPPVAEVARLVPAQPLADLQSVNHQPPALPPIVLGPDETVFPRPTVIPASAVIPQVPPSPELPRVPPPVLPAAPPVASPVVPVPPASNSKLPSVPPPIIPMPGALTPVPPAPEKLPLVPPPMNPMPAIPTNPTLPAPEKLPAVPPPATLPAPTPFVPPATPGVGSVALLSDGKLVEGTVTQVGEKVIVRRGSIDQPFGKDQVQFVGKSKDECYSHLLGKVKADDAPGRFKLARWCMYNGLREQALAEAKEVVKLQPNHTVAAGMVRSLEESIRLFNGDGTSKLPPPDASKPNAAKVAEPEPELAAEAANAFGPRVQPVLANLCADCHAKPSYAGPFKLACATSTDQDPDVAKQNIRAVLTQIRKNDPSSSPLLEKALESHGGMKQAAFANRQSPAFRVLEAWVLVAAAAAPNAPNAPNAPTPALPPPAAEKPKPVEPPKPVLPPPPVVKFGEDAKPAGAPAPGGDEFDPMIFNRAVGSK